MKSIFICLLIFTLSSCNIIGNNQSLTKNNETKIEEIIGKLENEFIITDLESVGRGIKLSDNGEKYIIQLVDNNTRSINFNGKKIIYSNGLGCENNEETICKNIIYEDFFISNFYISNSGNSYVTEIIIGDGKIDTLLDINGTLISIKELQNGRYDDYKYLNNKKRFFLDSEMFNFGYYKKKYSDSTIKVDNIDGRDVLEKTDMYITYKGNIINHVNSSKVTEIKDELKKSSLNEYWDNNIEIEKYGFSEKGEIISCLNTGHIFLGGELIGKGCGRPLDPWEIGITHDGSIHYHISDSYIKTNYQDFGPYKNIIRINMSPSGDLLIVTYELNDSYYYDILGNRNNNSLSKIFTYGPFDGTYETQLADKGESYIIEYEKYKEAGKSTYYNINGIEIGTDAWNIRDIRLSYNSKSFSYKDVKKQEAILYINGKKYILPIQFYNKFELHNDGKGFTLLISGSYKNFRIKT